MLGEDHCRNARSYCTGGPPAAGANDRGDVGGRVTLGDDEADDAGGGADLERGADAMSCKSDDCEDDGVIAEGATGVGTTDPGE